MPRKTIIGDAKNNLILTIFKPKPYVVAVIIFNMLVAAINKCGFGTIVELNNGCLAGNLIRIEMC